MASNIKTDVKDGQTSTPSRKTRPLRRKTSHSVIERRRREKINEGLINLQNLIPACHDELFELYLSKANSNKRNSKKSKEEIEKEVKELIKQKIKSSMVLEKLCIISHTVDYVIELQSSIEAYRKMCRCSPPLNSLEEVQSQSKLTNTHNDAHIFGSYDDSKKHSHTSNPESSPELNGNNCESCKISRAKGRRHWGSNNPLELAKSSSNNISTSSRKRSENDTMMTQLPSQRPKRDAAPTLSSMREDSVSITGSFEDDEQEEENDSDEASDLALDEWNENRRCIKQVSQISPPLDGNKFNHKENSDAEQCISLRSLEDLKDRSTLNTTQKTSNLSSSFTNPRKRNANDTASMNSHKVKLLKIEENKKGLSEERIGLNVDKFSSSQLQNSGVKCDDCLDDKNSNLIIGPKIRSIETRSISPSDRLLHKVAKTNDDRLNLFADIVTQR